MKTKNVKEQIETFRTQNPLKSISRGRTKTHEYANDFMNNLLTLEEAGNRKLLEKYKGLKTRAHKLQEAITKEQIGGGDIDDLYSTLMAQMVDEYVKPNLVARNVIREVQFGFNGYGGVKIPRELRKQAFTVQPDGTFPQEEDTTYNSRTADIMYTGAYSYITEQLRRKAAFDLLMNQFRLIADAINEQVDSDILTEMEKATTPTDPDYADSDDNVTNNIEQNISFDSIIDLMATVYDNNANVTDMLMKGSTWAKLNKDSDTKQASSFATTRVENGADVGLVHAFGTSNIHITSQMPDDTVYAVDRNKLGYFVNAGNVQMFDGRKSGTVQHEVLAIMPTAVKISNIRAVAKLVETP